jgi:hypothetical protein
MKPDMNQHSFCTVWQQLATKLNLQTTASVTTNLRSSWQMLLYCIVDLHFDVFLRKKKRPSDIPSLNLNFFLPNEVPSLTESNKDADRPKLNNSTT